jgi:hypothetical protein
MFPSSTPKLRPLLGALRTPPNLWPLPGTPPSGACIGRCPPPCPSCRRESFGRLGAPALTLLGDLADQAAQADGPGLSRAAFIAGALRELSIALRRGNASLRRLGANVATRASGQAPMCGLARPSAEVVEACFAPRVLVLGFWFALS